VFADLDIFAGSTALAVTGTDRSPARPASIIVPPTRDARVERRWRRGAFQSERESALGGLTSTNSTTFGVSLTDVSGAFVAPSSSAITNAAGTAFNILGGNATVTYNGTITDVWGRS
jgi:hypothetical protein